MLLEGLLQTWWVLLAVPLLVRLAVPGQSQRERGFDRYDVVLALLSGVVLALLCGFWLADFHLGFGPLTSSDFHEYCSGVVALREDRPQNFTRQRSMIAAAPSTWLAARVGLLDGMAGAALLSMTGIGIGLYGWGRALTNRLGGLVAVLAGATIAPLVNFSRTLSFYPETTAAFTLGAAAAVAAARWRTVPALVLCGATAGLCFLIDLRGLLWGLTVVGVGGLVVMAAPLRRWPLRLAALLLPVWLAWLAGPLAYSAKSSPLEGQTDLLKRISDKGGTADWDHSDLPKSEYIWGYSDPLEIPTTLLSLSEQARRIPAWMKDHHRAIWERENSVDPLLPLLIVVSVIVVVGLVRQRRWWVLMATVAMAVPFVASVRSAIALGQLFHRYLGTSAVLMAALMGASLSMLVGPGRWRLLIGTIVALLLTLGVLPSPLSPVAPWRQMASAQRADIVSFLIEIDQGVVYHRHGLDCGRGLREDVTSGFDHHGTLHGGMHGSDREIRSLQQRFEASR